MPYLVAHWRGKLSLTKSVLINGLLIYAILVVAFVSLGQIVTSQIFVIFGLSVFLAWAIWASVGIVRCSLRLTFAGNSAVYTRVFGIAAIIGVAIAVAYIVKDIWMIVLSPMLW